MKQKLIAIISTSEFWLTVGQVVVESMHAPIPVEAKVAAWVYIVARVVSKLAKYIVPKLGGTNA